MHIIGFWALFSAIGLKMIIPLYTQGKYLLKRFHNSVMNFTDFLEISHLSWAYNIFPRLPMPWNPSHSSTTIICSLLHKWASWWFIRQRICLQCRKCGFDSRVRKIPWRRDWLTSSIELTSSIKLTSSIEHRKLHLYVEQFSVKINMCNRKTIVKPSL